MAKWLMFSLSLFTCSLMGSPDPSTIDYVRFSDAISNNIIEEICKRFDFSPSSTSGGAMNVIRGFSFGFNVPRTYTQDEARRIVIECVEIAMKIVNQTREARPYFVEYPMTVSQIGVGFSVSNETNIAPLNSFLCHFGIDDDKENKQVIIYTFRATTPNEEEIKITEFFEDAQKTVHEERQKDPLLMNNLYKQSYIETIAEKSVEASSFISKITNLIDFTQLLVGKDDKYSGPPEDRAMGWSLDSFCNKLAKKQHLQFFRVGNFSEFCSGNEYSFGFSFLSSQKLSLKEARVLGASVMQSLIKELNTSKKVRIWREKYFSWGAYFATDPSKEIPLGKIGLKIAFWDDSCDRIMPPHIAQIAFLQQQLQYFEADPTTQQLRLVFSESYEDGLKFLESEQKQNTSKQD